MSRVYYNEIDPYAAQWLRNLIAAGEFPEGDVDERDIRDVQPEDVQGYTQAHFFAGIGGWPLALRLAGWPDDEPIWTGSCPCQPFSAAGKRKGVTDDRHLWPEFRRLITECAPRTVLGEQVASKDGLRDWYLAGVCPDLEARGYECGAVDLPAACLNAPHIRQRLWWVAQSRQQPAGRGVRGSREDLGEDARGASGESRGPSDSRGVAQSKGGTGWTEPRAIPSRQVARLRDAQGKDTRRAGESERRFSDRRSTSGRVGHAPRERREGFGLLLQPGEPRHASLDADGPGADGGMGDASGEGWQGARHSTRGRAGITYAGPWDTFDLVACRQPDGSLVSRRLEPQSSPLVDGFSFVLADGRARQDAPRGQILKGLGNAIVIPLAVEFLHAVLECRP